VFALEKKLTKYNETPSVATPSKTRSDKLPSDIKKKNQKDAYKRYNEKRKAA
jgi:hypothetical protein